LSATITEARDQILALFKAAWDTTGYTAIYDDRPGSTPDTTDPWARATVRHNTGRQATLADATGARRYDRLGLATFQVFTPVGDGVKLADELSQLLVDAYEGKSTAGGIWFFNVRANEIGVADGWRQTNVIAEFRYQQQKAAA
jgi:hypothetical protein